MIKRRAVFLAVAVMSGLMLIKDSTADGPPPTQPDNLWLWTGEYQSCYSCWDEGENWEFVGTLYPIYSYPQTEDDNVSIPAEVPTAIWLIDTTINSFTISNATTTPVGPSFSMSFAPAIDDEVVECDRLKVVANGAEDFLVIKVIGAGGIRTID